MNSLLQQRNQASGSCLWTDELAAIFWSLADSKTYRVTVNLECGKSLVEKTVEIGRSLALQVHDDSESEDRRSKSRVLTKG
jgi:hypothetical protein